MRLDKEILDHIKNWYAKYEEADKIPENGYTIGRLLEEIEALQQENEQLRQDFAKLHEYMQGQPYIGGLLVDAVIQRMEQLQAQVARMREALEKIAYEIPTTASDAAISMLETAYNTLSTDNIQDYHNPVLTSPKCASCSCGDIENYPCQWGGDPEKCGK